MPYINYDDVRINMCVVFESYLYFELFELCTSVKVFYELTPSVCIFSVTFKREEFVWVERFYKHLQKSFQDLDIKGWDDFEQLYDYGVEAYITYSLFCTRNQLLGFKFFRYKKGIYFCDILKDTYS